MGVFAGLVQDLRSRRDRARETFFPPDADALERHLPCPRCGREMHAHVYGAGGNAVISNCEPCEVNWIAYGGLDRIVRAPDYRYGAEL